MIGHEVGEGKLYPSSADGWTRCAAVPLATVSNSSDGNLVHHHQNESSRVHSGMLG
jgi:hypothetical protein